MEMETRLPAPLSGGEIRPPSSPWHGGKHVLRPRASFLPLPPSVLRALASTYPLLSSAHGTLMLSRSC